MSKKWMPMTAGVLEILAGCLMVASALYFLGMLRLEAPRPWQPWYFLWLIVPSFFGITSVVGGVYAVLCIRWRLARIGAIATLPLFIIASLAIGSWVTFEYGITTHYFYWLPLLFSIVIITLIVLSKSEFK